jgi:TRAP-type mannitol/chloroaromatic compound transport system permease small subunit
MNEPPICRVIDRINTWAGKLAALALFALILSLVYEVASRYFFNSPTIWVNETAQYLFGACFLLGGGFTLMHKGHVRVDILLTLFSKRTRRVMGIVCYCLSFLYLCILLIISSDRAWTSIYYMEQMDSMWKPYTFPVLICVPVGVALMLLQIISMIVKTVRKMKREKTGGGNA